MKRLIIIRGPSGVGKTTLAKLLIKNLKGNVAYLPVAKTTLDLLPSDVDFPSSRLVDLMHDNADSILRNFLNAGYTVVSDAIFSHKTKSKFRLKNMVSVAKSSDAKVYVFDLVADIKTLVKRAKKRSRPKDVKTKFKMIKEKNDNFLKAKYKDSIIIQTDNKSSKKILSEILKHLN